MASDSSATGEVWKLSRDEKLRLVNWLFALDSAEISNLAQRRLAQAFPTAPSEMIQTAEHHLYVDGKDAALNWLADLALCLRSPDGKPPSVGCDWDLLHHLYNWWQFRELLPFGRIGVRDLVQDVIMHIEENSLDAALAVLKDIDERLDGNVDVPQFGE